GCFRPPPRRAHARRTDLRAVPRPEASPGPPLRALHLRALPARRHGDARLPGPRHDLRSVPFLRPAGGDGAAPTIGVMEGHARISADVLAFYAADAAREVRGVRSLSEGPLPRRRGVRVTGAEGGGPVGIELLLNVDWGSAT